MKTFDKLIFIAIITCFCVVKCRTFLFDLQKITKTVDFYQFFAFVSDNYTKMIDSNIYSFYKIPYKLFSFDKNRQKFFHRITENVLKNQSYLQESLIIFYTTNLIEVKSFIDFLMPQLTVRKRPKCLITYSSSSCEYEDDKINIISSLKYAWEKKFLDFTVVESVSADLFSSIYYFNSFNDVVYEKKLQDGRVEVFPDKLCNSYGYSLYIPRSNDYSITRVRRANREVKIYTSSYFSINFAAKILNLTVLTKNDYTLEYPVTPDVLNKWNLDVFCNSLGGYRSYLKYFLIPSIDKFNDIVAFVPIIHTSHRDGFYKMFFNVMVMFVTFSSVLKLYSYFKVLLGFIRLIGGFDFIRLLLGQSIAHTPKKLVGRVIFITIIIASVKLTNDFLLKVLVTQFEHGEMAFDTYEELYKSKFEIYSFKPFYKKPTILEKFKNFPYLWKILNKTSIINDMNVCFNMLRKWKNVSCIEFPSDPNYYISKYQNPDGSPSMKIAQPPLFPTFPAYYWFADALPHAMKFHKIFQRVLETNLMHWPSLVYQNPKILDTDETNRVLISDGIESVHLLSVLSFGYSVAVTAFIIELIIFKIKKFKIEYILKKKLKF